MIDLRRSKGLRHALHFFANQSDFAFCMAFLYSERRGLWYSFLFRLCLSDDEALKALLSFSWIFVRWGVHQELVTRCLLILGVLRWIADMIAVVMDSSWWSICSFVFIDRSKQKFSKRVRKDVLSLSWSVF